MTDTTTRTIGDQVIEFNVGFNEAVGERLAAVFAQEQADLVAGGTAEGAVEVGDALPSATVVATDGTDVELSSLLGSGAVLVFYRGAWCPYCNITLKHYGTTLAPALEERGIRLIAISPQTPEGSEAAVAQGDLAYTVVSDPGNVLAGALGIVTAPSAEAQAAHTDLGFAVKDSNADDTPAIPFPTVVVVDADGIVRYADIRVDYTSRTESADILAAVDAR